MIAAIFFGAKMAEREIGANSENQLRLGQFRRIIGAMDSLSWEISQRTVGEEYKQNGFGSCGIPREVTEIDLGEIASEVLAMREEIGLADGSKTVEAKVICPHHRENGGCIVGTLKGPVCSGFFGNSQEILDIFGIDVLELRKRVRKDLKIVNGVGEHKNINPEQNEELAVETLSKIVSATEHIKSFPTSIPVFDMILKE